MARQPKYADLLGRVRHYEQLLDAMQNGTFYAEDEDGILRRWYPPSKLLTEDE